MSNTDYVHCGHGVETTVCLDCDAEKVQLISEMLAMLEELEWAGMANVRGDRCPVCLIPWQPPGNPNPPHTMICKLAALIKKAGKVVG